MENLSDPSKLGGGIAVAFVATIYGVGLANLFFLPVNNKLKDIVNCEVVRREMLSDIFYSIAQGDSTRIVEERVLNHR
jgi:chemotaxis protein MotA